jgi:hypothetical protein
MDFTETIHCRSGVHCQTCRDLERGRRWRADLGQRFSVPDGLVDFACPRGRPWGWKRPSRGLGDTVAKVIETVTGGRVRPCGGCHKRRAALNRLFPYST